MRAPRETKAEAAARVAAAVVLDVLRRNDLLDAIGDPDSDVVAYLRMSVDRDLLGANIERDALILGRWAVANGVRFRLDPETGLPFYVDNSVSGYKTKRGRATDDKRRGRPAHDRMVDAITRGLVARVVTPHADRLYRRTDELADLLALLKNLDGDLVITTLESGQVDLSTAAGRHIARSLTDIAQYESERIHERVTKEAKSERDAGNYVGSQAPFGYVVDRSVVGGLRVDPEAAAIIREAALDVIAGTSLLDIARRWDRTVPRIRAEYPWDATQVRQRLMRPALAALISYQPPAKDDGSRKDRFIYGPGAWEAILDPEEWAALGYVIGKNAATYAREPRRRGPFTGLFVCQVCGGRLYRHNRPKARGGHEWRCLAAKHLDPETRQCGKVAVDGPTAEAWVVEHYRDEAVARQGAEDAISDPGVDLEAASTEVAGIEAQLAEYRADRDSGLLDREEFYDLRDRAGARLRKAQLRLRTAQADKLGLHVRHIDASGIIDVDWAAATTDEKRLLLSYAFPHGIRVDADRALDVAERLAPLSAPAVDNRAEEAAA